MRNRSRRDGKYPAGLELRPVPAAGNGNIDGADFGPDGVLPPAVAEIEPQTISSNGDEDAQDVSQKDAILLCLGSRRKVQRHRHMLEQYVISPEKRYLFGFIACLWIVCWLVLGPLIVYVLTYSGEEIPLVLTGWTPCCGKRNIKSMMDHALEAKRAERYFHDCLSPWAVDKAGCDTLWAGNATPETHIYNTSCPFGPGTCLDGVSAVAFGQKITAESLGYNTPYKASLHRRLTCAPLNLSTFTLPRREDIPGDKNLLSFIDPEFARRNLADTSGTLWPYWLWLDTDNGPSERSPEYSGWDGYRDKAPFLVEMKLDVIPRRAPANRTFAQAILDPRLRHANATTFMMVFFAGQTGIRGFKSGPILDPVFKATRMFDDEGQENHIGATVWLPDHEATSIVCAEQFKLCAADNACSAWASEHNDEFGSDGQLLSALTDSSPLQIPFDQWLLLYNIFKFSSTFRYLDEIPRFLLAPARKYDKTMRWISANGQWIEELAALIDASFLRARFSLLGSVLKINDDYHCANNPNPYNEDPVFCRSFLFPAANYTNMNLLLLMVACFCAFAILGLSFSIELRRRPSHASGHVARVKHAWRAGWRVLGRYVGRVVRAAISTGKLLWRRGVPAIPPAVLVGAGESIALSLARRAAN